MFGDFTGFDLLATRYSNLRQFASHLLETFGWHSGNEQGELTDAIEIMAFSAQTNEKYQ
jgi:hypothetical protein